MASFLMNLSNEFESFINQLTSHFNRATWELLIIFAVLLIVSILILSFYRSRKKINWMFVIIFTIIYFEIVFLDFGSSTPYALSSCNGTAHESNQILSFMLERIGWISYPIIMLFNTILGFTFFITANYLSKLPQSQYKQGFIMGLVFVFVCLIFAIHIDASINNYLLCAT